MNKPIANQNNVDLAFFGKINASISHELKNILATISEASGLLNDLAELVEKGKTVDMGMFKTCSRGIEEEIQRGFETVKGMNAFSHSVDKIITEVSIVELVKRMIEIAGYLSYASKVRLLVSEHTDPVISTSPFRLQQMIYQALVFAFKMTGPEEEIRISIDWGDNNDVTIAFSDIGELGDAKFPVEQIIAIGGSINATFRMTDDLRAFGITIPKAII